MLGVRVTVCGSYNSPVAALPARLLFAQRLCEYGASGLQ